MKNNLEHNALPTADEIKLYQEGKLDAMRSHEIELIAEENPLLADAIEGYTVSPSYHMVPAITATIAASASASAAAGSAGAGVAAAAKLATPWWHLNGWLIGVGVGTSAAIGTYTYLQSSNQTSNQNENQNAIASVNVVDNQTNINASENTTAPYEQAAQSAEINSTSQETATTSAVTPNESQNQITQVVAGSEGTNQNSGSLAEITPVTPSSEILRNSLALPSVQTTPISSPELKKSSTVAIQIMHVMNYKLADYTVIRRDEWEKFSLDEVGVSAKYNSAEDKQKYLQDHPDAAVPYVEYVSQCIKAFDEAKYDMAIRRFHEVLEQYPDDVNALFYSAMSYFDLKQYDKAVELFTKVEKNMIKTFKEESMFYHAKSLKALDRMDEATSLFVKVVQQNGFYREHALEEMQ